MAFGLFFPITTLFLAKVLLKYIKSTLIDYLYFFYSLIMIVSVVLFAEFVALFVYIKDNPIPLFHIYIWLYVLFFYLIMALIICMLKCNCRVSAPLCVLLQMVLYLGLIYFYALPTFLLLLVYPAKVIAIVAYLITYVFSGAMICSVLILLCKHKLRTTSLYSVSIATFFIFYFLFVFLFTLGMVFPLVYALVFGQLSAITAGPYTVLSLIPTAAISIASWILKTKIFGRQKFHLDNTDFNPECVPNNTSVHANDNEDTEHTMLLPVDDTNNSQPGTSSESTINRRNTRAQDYGAIP